MKRCTKLLAVISHYAVLPSAVYAQDEPIGLVEEAHAVTVAMLNLRSNSI